MKSSKEKYLRVIKSFCLVTLLSLCCAMTAQFSVGCNYGLLVTNVRTGHVIAQHNADVCFTPASITKLITTATAIEMLGPDFRFSTLIATDVPLADSVLPGNLYIVGGGDPTLGSDYIGDPRFMAQWCQMLQDKGIRRITGSVVADASCFDRNAVPGGWTWEDMGNYYGAGAYGISVYDNTLRVTLRSKTDGLQPQIITVAPQVPGLIIDNRLIARNNSGDKAYFYGMPFDNRRIVCGTIPANAAHFTIRSDIPNPPLLVAQQLTDALRTAGIIVDGEPYDCYTPSTLSDTLFVVQSPALAEIIKETNYHSINFFAEHLLKCIALQRDSIGANTDTAIAILKDFWCYRGIDLTTLHLTDGSGLSPQNAFTPRVLNDILCYMYTRSPYAEIFYESLPVAGESGTVRNLFKKTSLAGKAHLKSGSMRRVQCYAGYIESGDATYAITVMVNNFSDARSTLRKQIEKMVLDAVSEQR